MCISLRSILLGCGNPQMLTSTTQRIASCRYLLLPKGVSYPGKNYYLRPDTAANLQPKMNSREVSTKCWFSSSRRRNFKAEVGKPEFGSVSVADGRLKYGFCSAHNKFRPLDDCAYEDKLQHFKRTMLLDLDYEYDLFLQDMRQFFLRDGIDLYNLTFLKNFLKNSMKRDADVQVSSIIFFRKKRRHLTFLSEDQYFWEINKHVEEFYDQRYHQISKTFSDLCLHYDKAAKVIFESLAKEDQELYQLLHDNQYFVKLIGSSLLMNSKEYEDKVSKAFSILKSHQEQLIEVDDDIRERGAELEWILYMANLIRAYDRIYEATGLEEEDVRLLAHKQFKQDYLEKIELDLLQKVKAKYIPPRAV